MIARRLTRWLYPYGSIRIVLRGPASGRKFLVRPGMGASFALGYFDSGYRFLSKYLYPGNVIYDVGANRGQFSLLLSSHDCQIFAFEPVAPVFEDLCGNIHLNSINHIQPFHLALSNETGEAWFLFDEATPTQGRLEQVEPQYRNDGERVRVQTMTMDDFVESGHAAPDLIKIDVEGGAFSVLRGARHTIETHRPGVLVELHGPEEQQGVKTELLDRGYQLSTLTGESVTDPVGEWHGTLWCQPEQ